jgi:ligand-binding SRPBCC domain-containing protein
MTSYTLQRESTVPRPISDVFHFFSTAENLERITPPWLKFRIVTPLPIAMHEGARIEYQLRLRGFPLNWLTEIECWNPPFEFVDVQLRGPYSVWRHTHSFYEEERGTRVVDTVNYALPFGPLGRLAHRLKVARDLSRIFDYREQKIRSLLAEPETPSSGEFRGRRGGES